MAVAWYLLLLVTVTVRRAAAAATCAELVPHPIDQTPMRSPQSIHTAMLPFIAGRHVVEIGTRNGDGVTCFSRVASKVTAVELDKTYCRRLEARALSLRTSGERGFDVHCEDYRQSRADALADVYTWWQEPPELSNLHVLRELKSKLDSGLLKPTLVALINFDPKYQADALDLRLLQEELRLTTSVAKVPHDERSACLRTTDAKLRKHKHLCERAHGYFVLAQVPVARVNASALEHAICRWVSQRAQFCPPARPARDRDGRGARQ